MRYVCVFFTLLLFAGMAFAQSTGSINGTVTDATGAVLPNATVTITNQATGETHTLKTSSAGLYSISGLAPGNYRVEVQSQGMQAVVANNLVVAVATVTTQNFTMQVAATSSTIEIQASAPVVESSSVSVGTVINQRTVQEIPLNGRHFVDLALLIPGSVTPPANGFLTAPLRGQGSFAFNSAGAREDEINFMINGIQMSDMSQNQITFQPTINTVEEFKIDNSTYSAEYGRNAGSIVNIATRAGTNQVHGEVYYFLRNNALDARNFGNPSITQPQAPFRRNQFGADGGGPIKKDKTFLFLSYEGLVQRQSVPLTSTAVLSAAQRAQVTDPIVQKLLPLIPLPNSPGNAYISSAVAPVNIHQGTANFTQQFTENNRFNAYYAMQHDQRNEPPSTQGNTLPGFGDSRQGWRQLLTLNDSATLSSNMVNEARAGFNRIHIVFAAQNTLNAADYGINSGVTAPIGLPQISVTGAFEFGGISGFPQGRGDDTITLSDTLSWVHGKHTIKFGPEGYHVIADSFSYTPGTFTFPSITAFMKDQANAFSANASNRAARVHINSVGAFVQDSWKVTSHLTLDLGLRYDWNGTPTEAEDRFVVFDPSALALEQVGKGGPDHAYAESAKNFEPRVGFAWDPFGNGKTVVRSAYAIFVDQPIEGLVGGLTANPPFAFPVNITTSGPNLNFGDAYTLASGSVAPTSVAQNYRNPYVQSWNFNIQQELGNTYGVMIGYFGNKGTDLNIGRNYNQPINGIRPFAALSASSPIDPLKPLGNITVYESDANSSYNALWLTAQKHFSHGLQFDANYTWSKSIDENSRNEQGVVVQNSYNLEGDRGLSDFDARNRFVLSGVYDLPFKGNRFVEGWEFSLIEQIQSGNPINFHTTNTSFTGASTVRPSVTGPVITGYSPATNLNAALVTYIQNPLVFYNQGNAFGNLGRNVIIGPGFSNLDLAMVKDTKITERLRWQFRADAFDLLNQANFNQPGSTLGTSSFGLISATRFPPGDSGSSRQLQLSMKLIF